MISAFDNITAQDAPEAMTYAFLLVVSWLLIGAYCFKNRNQ